MNYADFKEPTPKPPGALRVFGFSGDLKRYQNPRGPSTLSPQKNIRGLVGHWRIVKSALPRHENRPYRRTATVASLRPRTLVSRSLRFHRRIAPAVFSMGLSFVRARIGAKRELNYHSGSRPSMGFLEKKFTQN